MKKKQNEDIILIPGTPRFDNAEAQYKCSICGAVHTVALADMLDGAVCPVCDSDMDKTDCVAICIPCKHIRGYKRRRELRHHEQTS